MPDPRQLAARPLRIDRSSNGSRFVLSFSGSQRPEPRSSSVAGIDRSPIPLGASAGRVATALGSKTSRPRRSVWFSLPPVYPTHRPHTSPAIARWNTNRSPHRIGFGS